MKEETNTSVYRIAWVVVGDWCQKMGNLQQKMAHFWSMAVDDATTDSQPIRKETQHRNNARANVNDTTETLISDMLKNVHEACETLEARKSALEIATLATAMESKVTLSGRFQAIRGSIVKYVRTRVCTSAPPFCTSYVNTKC